MKEKPAIKLRPYKVGDQMVKGVNYTYKLGVYMAKQNREKGTVPKPNALWEEVKAPPAPVPYVDRMEVKKEQRVISEGRIWESQKNQKNSSTPKPNANWEDVGKAPGQVKPKPEPKPDPVKPDPIKPDPIKPVDPVKPIEPDPVKPVEPDPQPEPEPIQPDPVQPVDPVEPGNLVFSRFTGANAFEWHFTHEQGNTTHEINEAEMANLNIFRGGIRHYLDWHRIETEEGRWAFNPTLSGLWYLDKYYSRAKQDGLLILACIKTLPPWLSKTWPENVRDEENVPVRWKGDLAATIASFAFPASYIESGRMHFQFAARYGHNKNVDPALVSVDTKNPHWDPNKKEIGLGLIRYQEVENERDKTWKGRKAEQTPGEYAAMLSTCYDGHMGTLGPGVGIKNADPSMQVVMGGLAWPYPSYVDGMVDWCIANRGHLPNGRVNLCWDVINYHQYCNDGKDLQHAGATRGACPESGSLLKVAQAFVAKAKERCYGMEVWQTETGYDVSQHSTQRAISIGDKSRERVQADWILRTSLLYAHSGVSRAMLYTAYDTNSGNEWGTYARCGMLNDDGTRRPAAYFLNQGNAVQGNYPFHRQLSANPRVHEYRRGEERIFALWMPTERGATATYVLPLPGVTSITLYTLHPDSMTPTAQKISISGNYQVSVSETPVFVKVNTEQNI